MEPATAGLVADPDYPLLTYLDELVEQLRTHVSKALKQWDETAIHQARVATRRLKSALDLYKPVLSKSRRRPFGRELRKLRRRLGPLRDLDVMIGHVGEFANDARLAPAAAWVAATLCREREAARELSRSQPAPAKVLSRLGQWWGIRDQFAEAREAVDTLLAESLHLQIDAFAEQAEQLLAHQHAVEQAKRAGSAEPAPAENVDASPAPAAAVHIDPHQLRIAGKALRYTLEMAAKQGHKPPKNVGKVFKQMQEHLGLWHDYVVLSDRVLSAAVADLLGHHDAATMEKVLDLSKVALRRSTREIGRFYRLWTEQGEALARGIRTAFPLSRQVVLPTTDAETPVAATESQTDPGPADSAPSPAPAPCSPAPAANA